MDAARSVLPSPGRFRLELGGGYGVGDHDGLVSGKVLGGRFTGDLDSVFGGSGPAWGAGVWIDETLTDNVSFGLQFIRIHNSSEASVVLPPVINLASDISADLDIDLYFANAAWRPGRHWRAHPYIGAGLGAALIELELQAITVSGLDSGTARSEIDSPAPAAQLFLGVDVDLGAGIYIGGNARVVFLPGSLFEVDQDFKQFSMMGLIGFRF